MNNNTDMVNHPDHYTHGNIECIEALKEATKDLKGIEAICTANAIKYLWRWKFKNGLEDLKKAIWYTERLIKEIEENTENDSVQFEEWTGKEPKNCCNCVYFDCEEFNNPNCPCDKCKKTVFRNDPEYKTRPLYYHPKK